MHTSAQFYGAIISAAGTGYKWFYQTAPMILQNGGQLYKQNEDGIVTTGIDTKESVKGLQVLGDLFTKYSLDTSVQNFFNSFRYSTLPIGIIGMEDYTLINNGAQELEGQWDIAPYIGTKRTDENGNEYIGGFFKLANDIYFYKSDFEINGDFYNNGNGFIPIGLKEGVYSSIWESGSMVYNVRINFDGENKYIKNYSNKYERISKRLQCHFCKTR